MYTEHSSPMQLLPVRKTRQSGISLIELVMFIVIVSLGIAGILSVMNVTTKASADPMQRKQAMAIAESLLEEIELQPFTYCDPDDANALTATSAAGCATTPQGLGATTGETRYLEPRFDNVGDYQNFTMTGVKDIQNNPVPGLDNYIATVTMTQSSANVIQIDVAVSTSTGPTAVMLTGYRYRYAPRAVP